MQILQDTFLEVRRKKDGEEAGKLLQVQAVLFEGRLGWWTPKGPSPR